MRAGILAAAALFATAGQAQVLGTPLPPVSAGGSGQIGVGIPDPVPTIDRSARDVTTSADRTTRLSKRDRKAVRVDAGASVRVERGRRCYYDDYYYDPYYRDGAYYCERRGTEVGADARIGSR